MSTSAPRSIPFGMLLLLAATGFLYVAMLSTISFSTGGGDASFGQAMASLFFTVALWIALVALLGVGGAMGEMPRSAAIASMLLVPLSGIATFVAIDMCSRHIKWAIIFPVALPLLIALYALWARLPALRARIPADRMGVAVWSSVFILSCAALVAASVI